jgi:hypothetical protein
MGLQSKVEANSRWKPGRVLRCGDSRCLKGPMGPSSPQPPEPRMLARYGILGLVESRPRQRVIVAKSAVYLLILLSAVVVLPVQAPGQGGPQETTYRRSVPRDAETMVGSAARWRNPGGQGLCSTRYIPDLELVTPPKHGAVRFVTTDIGAPRGSACINSVYGQAVLYQPASGFVGEDRFTYKSPDDPTVMNWTSVPGLKTVIVTVRDQNTLPR